MMKTVSWNNNRGSVLIVAIIFATVMALSVGSFLKLANSEARLASVAFHSNSALNLAEAGVERALYALNHYGEDSSWPGWSGGTVRSLDQEVIDLGGNVVGHVNARVDLSSSSNPVVQVGGKVVLSNRPDVEKQLEVRLGRRSLFANGITTKRGVTFKGGNVEIDSYRSSLGPPSPSNRLDNGSVASASVEVQHTVSISNSTVFGRVATGGPAPSVGPNGRIYGYDTPAGLKIDPERVARDFAADFPEIDPPTHFDGFSINMNQPLGNPSATKPVFYQVSNLSVSNDLRIVGPVVIYVTGSIDVKNAKIIVEEGGSATFYVDGNVTVGGNPSTGINNVNGDPSKMVIFGTGSNQTFKLHGNGQMHAAIYAPNASVDMKGGGNSGMMAGAIIADSVFMNGNYSFHYDEDLEGKFATSGYGMTRWRELFSAADRIQF